MYSRKLYNSEWLSSRTMPQTKTYIVAKLEKSYLIYFIQIPFESSIPCLWDLRIWLKTRFYVLYAKTVPSHRSLFLAVNADFLDETLYKEVFTDMLFTIALLWNTQQTWDYSFYSKITVEKCPDVFLKFIVPLSEDINKSFKDHFQQVGFCPVCFTYLNMCLHWTLNYLVRKHRDHSILRNY